jgi:two-component sensor histidine kinase
MRRADTRPGRHAATAGRPWWAGYGLLQERIAVFDDRGRLVYANGPWQAGGLGTGCQLSACRDLHAVAGSAAGAEVPGAVPGGALLSLAEGHAETLDRECSCDLFGAAGACRIRATAQVVDGRRVVVVLQNDLSLQRRVERALRRVVADREALLREVHHRVKNNLQIILSLLAMQLRTLDTEQARRAVRDTRMRVRAIAAVHERLCDSDDLARLDLGEYVQALVPGIFASMSPEATRVDLQVACESVHVGLDDAVRCGLVVNELVSNALKYAFVGRGSGTLAIGLARVGTHRAELTVTDDGVGLPAHIDTAQAESLGLHLAAGLAQRLGGRLEVERRGGTTFRVSIAVAPEPGGGSAPSGIA